MTVIQNLSIMGITRRVYGVIMPASLQKTLHNLQHQNFERPILVYSQATNKNFVIQALSLGAKNYLVKPQKPDVILRTVFETLRSQL